MSIEIDDNKEENLSYAEIITLLERICRSPIIDEESQHMLSSVMKKVEDLQKKANYNPRFLRVDYKIQCAYLLVDI